MISVFAPIHSISTGPTFLSVGIVNIVFQSAGTGKYATLTGHLNFHFAPLVVSYETFPMVKSKTIEFLLHQTQSTLQLRSEEFRMSYFWKELPSSHYVGYSRVAGTCYRTYMVHVTPL